MTDTHCLYPAKKKITIAFTLSLEMAIIFSLYFSGCCNPESALPLLKSAVQRGLSTRPWPGLEGEIGGEKDTVLLLQSSSWSREGSNRGLSSSNIPQSLLGGTPKYTQTHICIQRHILSWLCTQTTLLQRVLFSMKGFIQIMLTVMGSKVEQFVCLSPAVFHLYNLYFFIEYYTVAV